MLGARSSGRPAAPGSSSSDSSADEVSQLDHHLQTQLEEDIARIFDESIYSDIELVCGKNKIQTHSCILKARTYKFYNELEAILHVNVNFGSDSFDELYSFISDVYTECNINQQEKQILKYLKENLGLEKTVNKSEVEEKEDPDVYSTPNCVSPEEKNFEKVIIGGSPSTELTKEFYALVPIEADILDKELIEQDALSDAFQSIKKEHKNIFNELIKPTSLNLTDLNKHSNNCDLLLDATKITVTEEKKFNNSAVYTPDSLVTDEPSSSSDYLSAAYAASPVVTIMDNVATISDSGLETAESLNLSLNSHKDVTLDLSLTESTLNDINERYRDSSSNVDEMRELVKRSTSLHSPTCGSSTSEHLNDLKCNKSSTDICDKIFKERQNEEIVLLESSSVSSETGSWESVFPPKLTDKELNENTTKTDVQKITESIADMQLDDGCTSLVEKSSFKSTSCFIDAANLADEEEVLNIESDSGTQTDNVIQPEACTSKPDELSENDDDDSLEQMDNKSKEDVPFVTLSIKASSTMVGQKTTEPATDSGFDHLSMENVLSRNECSTPNNSMICMKHSFKVYENEYKHKELVDKQEHCNTHNNRNSHESPKTPRKIEDIPGMSDAYTPEPDPELIQDKPRHSSGFSFWVVDMSITSNNENENENSNPATSDKTVIKKAGDKTAEKSESKPTDSDSSEKSNKNFYIDLSKIPDALPPEQKQDEAKTKNIFTMFIDLDDKTSAPKDTPARLASSSSTKKRKADNKSSYKISTNASSDGKLDDTIVFEKLESLCANENISFSDIVKETKSAIETSKMKEKEVTKNEDFVTGALKKRMTPYVDYNNITSVPKEIPARLSSSSKKTKPDTMSSSKRISNISTNASSDLDNSTYKKMESCANEDITSSEIVNSEAECSMNGIETSKINPKHTGDFVKLSDLDKPAPKVCPASMKNKEDPNRMTRSIPDNDWRHLSETSCLRSTDIISSFHSENAVSLNRLFPHLKNEFSRSMPGSLSTKSKSTLATPSRSVVSSTGLSPDADVTNSAQSSYCRYVLGDISTESDQTSSLINSCQSRLGQDLLRMFIDEIATDVIVEVAGRRIKAHQCILTSRCQYFAAFFSGRRVESAGNLICMPRNFSYNAVHFALCHIYSGVSTIPENVNMVELATLADMFCLEGLKEAIMLVLKNKYCHRFHQPCPVCIAGVLESFPVADVYGLDDLYRKCIRWISKYFPRVWPTKAFATLPSELSQKCCQELIINMSLDNVVEYACGVGITLASLPRSRWADVVEHLCRKLMASVCEFAAASLCGVVRAVAAVPASAPFAASPAAVHELRAAVLRAMDRARPPELCRACVLLEQLQQEPGSLLDACLSAWRLHCEVAVASCLQHFAAPACEMSPRLLARLQHLGCVSMQHELECELRANRHSASLRRQPGVTAAPRCMSAVTTEARRQLTVTTAARRPGSATAAPRRPVTASAGTRRPVTAPVAPRRQPFTVTRTVRSTEIDQVRACFVPYAQRPQLQPRLGSVSSLAERDARGTKPAKTHPTAARNGTTKEKIVPSVRTTKAQEKRAKYNSTKKLKQPLEATTAAVKPVRSVYEHAKPRYLEARGSRQARGAPLSSGESSRNASPVLARNRPRTADPSSESPSHASHDKFATFTRSKDSVESVTAVAAKQQSKKPVVKGKTTKIPLYLNRHQPSVTSVRQHQQKQNGSSTGQWQQKPRSSSDAQHQQKHCGSSDVQHLEQEKYQQESQEATQPAGTTAPLHRSGTFLKLLGPTDQD